MHLRAWNTASWGVTRSSRPFADRLWGGLERHVSSTDQCGLLLRDGSVKHRRIPQALTCRDMETSSDLRSVKISDGIHANL